MFEFEIKGGMQALQDMEMDLLEYLGYGPRSSYYVQTYDALAKKYGTDDLTHAHEKQLCDEHGPACFITDFPEHTSPFWNMQKNGPTSSKIDVILSGQETIGSAERSTDPEVMRNEFQTISDGQYARTLYAKFGRERVDAEMDAFLDRDFFPRSGGGIGVTRLIRSMKELDLLA